jgi:hypothetical protein
MFGSYLLLAFAAVRILETLALRRASARTDAHDPSAA